MPVCILETVQMIEWLYVYIKARERKFAFCFIDCQHLRDRTRAIERERERKEDLCTKTYLRLIVSRSMYMSLSSFLMPVCIRKMWLIGCESRSTTMTTTNNSRIVACTYIETCIETYKHTYKSIKCVFRWTNKLMQSLLTIKCHSLQQKYIMATIQWSYFAYYIFDTFSWHMYLRTYKSRMV